MKWTFSPHNEISRVLSNNSHFNHSNAKQLIQDHLKEMFSVIYTPTEGDAIQNYSRLFRKPEGCFLNINDVGRVHDDLAQWGSPEDIDYIVVTGNQPNSSFKPSRTNIPQMGKKSLASETKVLEAFSSPSPNSSLLLSVLVSTPIELSQLFLIAEPTTKSSSTMSYISASRNPAPEAKNMMILLIHSFSQLENYIPKLTFILKTLAYQMVRIPLLPINSKLTNLSQPVVSSTATAPRSPASTTMFKEPAASPSQP